MPKKIIVSVHATLIIFALFTLLFGLKLRFSNLNLPFWGDEYQTINAAKGIGRLPGEPSLTQAWKIQRLEMMHPPAFMVMLHFWLKVNTATAWIRLLPSLIGLIGLVYLIKLGIESEFKLTPILLVTSLATVSWVFVHYSEEVGSYSLSISAAFALIYYVICYVNQSSRSKFIKLLLVSLVNLFVYFGSWFYLPIVGSTILFLAIQNKKYSHLINFIVIGGLVITFLYFDQLQYKWGFATSGYLTRHKLSSAPVAAMPVKVVKDNIDYFTYVFGATPWYVDATFFPTTARFGASFTFQYYLSLTVVGIIMLGYYLYLCLINSRDHKEFVNRVLPLYFLFAVLAVVNLASLAGLYPIGAVRMSLFYAPIVIWLTLQFFDMVVQRFNLVSLIIIAFIVMAIINGMTRLYRMPQRHIGNNVLQALYYPS
ncbi:hypothetical protein A2875_00600 [Candidatus Gottesmanbacteria bacterium RIFCSPHIGHO2_01_FULL_46_14]|uniref:Glycosyltransferase RgtA/B/C/D-like domain-containing protein n=1 Tax=Candidatus Gottesmanbacteria bacterium RIFCSPHIGHO2_01_FULL_46_14 TaxID=1798380 RepID=A0A1F5ZT42_9BACT|nr:MAG: hypothetical protein A2875_00600 [Candidatus Gottesmanbacteria bacterium RIFCSPHIGHO2_01_FULL_46_14]